MKPLGQARVSMNRFARTRRANEISLEIKKKHEDPKNIPTLRDVARTNETNAQKRIVFFFHLGRFPDPEKVIKELGSKCVRFGRVRSFIEFENHLTGVEDKHLSEDTRLHCRFCRINFMQLQRRR